jgi:hypothetical protein
MKRRLYDAARELRPSRYRRAVGSAGRTPPRCTLELKHAVVMRDLLNDAGRFLGE